MAQLAGVLQTHLTGVSAKLGVSTVVVTMTILCGIQRLLEARRHRERGGRPSVRGTAMVVDTANRVLMDTAATMPIVWKDLMHLARNVRPLPYPINLETANGLVEV